MSKSIEEEERIALGTKAYYANLKFFLKADWSPSSRN